MLKKISSPLASNGVKAYHSLTIDTETGDIVSVVYLRREFTAETAVEAGQAYLRDRVKRAKTAADWRDTIRASDAENLTPSQRASRLHIGAGGNITQGCSVMEEHATIRAREYIEDGKNTVLLLQLAFNVDLQTYLFDYLKQAVQAGI